MLNRVLNTTTKSLLLVGAMAGVLFILSGCEQATTYSAVPVGDSHASIAAPSPDNGNSPPPKVPTLTSESFGISVAVKKNIDMLFVVDNSGSMSDDQANLKDGFASIANAYFSDINFNICVMIITTDRYLSVNDSASGSHERYVGCSNPDGIENLSQADRDAYHLALIEDFKTKVNVGITGSGYELQGKSLATFLFNQNKYSATMDRSSLNGFFRAHADAANISIISDEQNYFKGGVDPGEAFNDIPNKSGVTTPIHTVDQRRGIQEELDEYFSRIGAGASKYNITALLKLADAAEVATNIRDLANAVGRGSVVANLKVDAAGYAAVYQGIMTQLMTTAGSLVLANNIYEPGLPNVLSKDFKVVLQHPNGIAPEELVYQTDYTILLPNIVSFTPSRKAMLNTGDSVAINYVYLK